MTNRTVNRAKPESEPPHAGKVHLGPALEAASRTIRIDHLADKADSTVIPCFLDSKSVPEAVVSLLDYHGQAQRLTDVALMENIVATGKTSALVLFGINEAISYVVIDNAYYEKLKALPEGGSGSDLETCAVILDTAYQMRRMANAEGKGEFDAVFSLDEG